MINKIIEFMKQAGDIALSVQSSINLTSEHKQKDHCVFNVVTKADLDISDLFESFVKENFSHLNYIIVDEEKLSTLGVNPADKIANAEYAFVLDPIDGTQPFALKMPEYGISVGVLRYGKPYLGAIYCPAIRELVYFDGHQSHWLQNVFTEAETSCILKPNNSNSRALVFDNSWVVKINDNVDFSKDTVISLYSAVMHMLYIATGRGKCYYFGVYLWDMAGSWALLKNLGFEFINYSSGKILEEFSGHVFNDKIKIKETHIICRPEDFEHFKNIAILK